MPLRGKTKKDVLVEFRHAEILEAARRVFAQKGFEEASVDAIAHSAGVAKGTLYLYYSSKRDIFWEALKCGLDDLCDRLEESVRAAGSTEEKIRAFMVTKLNYFEGNRDFFKFYLAEFSHAVAQQNHAKRVFKECHRRQLRLVMVALKGGMRQSLPLEATAFAILNLTHGMITRRLLGWTNSTIEEDIAFMFDLTWKGIAGR